MRRLTTAAILAGMLVIATQATAQTVVDKKGRVIGTAGNGLIIKIKKTYYRIDGVNRRGFERVAVDDHLNYYYYASANCTGDAYVDISGPSGSPTTQDLFVQPANIFGTLKNPNNDFYYGAVVEYVSSEPPNRFFQFQSYRSPQDLNYGECSQRRDRLELAGKIARSTLRYTPPFKIK